MSEKEQSPAIRVPGKRYAPPRGTEIHKNNRGAHIYNESIGEKILVLVAEEGMAFTAACREVGVDRRTASNWVANSAEFARKLAIARQICFEHWASEIIELSDESALRGKTYAQIQAARLQIDSRKWLLSKLNPGKYGDRVELTGKDGKDLIPTTQDATAAVPRLMQVLAVLLPGTGNSDLMKLALTMASKLGEVDPDHPQKLVDGKPN